MANTLAGNVLRVDTTGTYTWVRNIESIRYIGNTSGTAVITVPAGNESGNKLWEESGSSNSNTSFLDIRSPQGITVTVTNGAIVYIYMDNC